MAVDKNLLRKIKEMFGKFLSDDNNLVEAHEKAAGGDFAGARDVCYKERAEPENTTWPRQAVACVLLAIIETDQAKWLGEFAWILDNPMRKTQYSVKNIVFARKFQEIFLELRTRLRVDPRKPTETDERRLQAS
jgi:hypothetical protein